MALAPGTKLGPYEIIAPIGAGGMGEVFRAKDTRLGREVAVKILPQAFALDPERLRRFTAEAQAVAALNHPNILAIHDVGSLEGSQYIVMEFLDGESLRERLTTGALSVRKATEYAEQIAKGLAAAHDKGIVHRDLKPDNIFVTRDGHVKILDFGLAKLTGTEPARDPGETMTRTSATQPGVVLGTVGYMSPEQVRGQVADQRSDIFSFGAIFYEMLTGKRAFTGDSSVEVMSAILKEEPPPLTENVRAIPPALDRIVNHCLEKNPAERFQSARDVAFNIGSLSDMSSSGSTSSATANAAAAAAASASATPAPQVISPKQKFAIRTLAAAYVLFSAAALWYLWHQRPQHTVVTFDRVTYRVGSVGAARFTADGQTIIFDAAWDGVTPRLYQWRADTPQALPMGLDDARVVGISKTNELALLLHQGALDRLPVTLARAPLSGGAPRQVLDSVRDAAWSPDGQLAVVHVVKQRDRLEYPIGKVLYETGGWISNPRFSADGRTIAFLDHTYFPDAGGTVSIVDLNGKREVLTGHWDDTRGLAWRGDEILYGGASENWDALRAVDLHKNDRMILSLPSLIEMKDVAPDGRVLIDSRNNRIPILGRSAGMDRERDLSWLDISILGDISRDGKQILLTEENLPTDGPGVYSFGMRGMDGSPVVRLGEGVNGHFSADGKWAVTVMSSKPPKVSVFPLAAGDGQVVALPGLDRLIGGVGFFPDGKKLWLNAADTTGASRAFAVEISGGGTPTPITPEGILAEGVSDDGETVVGSDENLGVTFYPLAGGPPRSIPNSNSSERFVQWGPDAHSIYVRGSGVPTPISLVNIATGQKNQVLNLVPADPSGVQTLYVVAMTRDAKSYAYCFRRSLSQLLLVQGLK
jgi:eukaryotic-like serine/threonine-protein kinase